MCCCRKDADTEGQSPQDHGGQGHSIPSGQAEVPGPVPSIVEVGRKGPRFMGPLPVGRGTVIVVGVHMMVVGVHPGQEGATGGTAHGGRDKRVIEVDPLVSHYAQGLWHDFHGT